VSGKSSANRKVLCFQHGIRESSVSLVRAMFQKVTMLGGSGSPAGSEKYPPGETFHTKSAPGGRSVSDHILGHSYIPPPNRRLIAAHLIFGGQTQTRKISVKLLVSDATRSSILGNEMLACGTWCDLNFSALISIAAPISVTVPISFLARRALWPLRSSRPRRRCWGRVASCNK